MEKYIKILTALAVLTLLTGGVMAAEKNYPLVDTQPVAEDFGEIWIDGKIVATVDEYNNSSCIQEKILDKDPEAIIKHVTKNSVDEVTSVDNPDEVYEYLTNDGMYYSFGKNNKTYIVTIDSKEWKGSMLKEMDEWCLENSK